MRSNRIQILRTTPGIVGLVCVGVAVLEKTLPGNPSHTIGLVVTGCVLLVLYAALNASHIRTIFHRRSARQGANAVVLSVLFAAALVLVQAISVENRHQIDLTRGTVFSLAPQTIKIIKGLGAPVSLRGFFRRGSDAAINARVLFQMYQLQGRQITWEIVDPDRNPRMAQEAGARQGDVLVTAAGRHSLAHHPTEQAITSAILHVTRTQQTAVYFLTGHGEKRLDNKDRGGYSLVRSALEEQGYTVRELSLLDVKRIPDDCELLVVAGPIRALLASELDRMRAWLAAGGSALFLIDPRRKLPGIEGVLSTYRIALDPVVLLDKLVVVGQGGRNFDATVAKVRHYGRHEITAGFHMITLYPMARPVRITKAPAGDVNDAHYLAWTGKSSWGETNMDSFREGRATYDDDDYAPPLPVGAAVEHGGSSPGIAHSRIVIYGDSDFANNTFFGLLGNRDLFLNSVAWLTRDENLISIRAKRRTGDRVFITAAQGRLVFVLCLIFPPLAVLSVGATVLSRRRKR